MKKMLLNKKNLYIKLTAVLILMIVGILGIYTAFVQKIATGQCFNILDDSRERMGQMIVNEMQNEQDHLEAASYLLKNLMTDCDANEEMVLQIMRASSADKSYAPLDYSDWELLILRRIRAVCSWQTATGLPRAMWYSVFWRFLPYFLPSL